MFIERPGEQLIEWASGMPVRGLTQIPWMGIRVLPDYCGGSNKELPLSPNSQCNAGLHGNSRTIRAGLAPRLDHPTVHTTSIPGRLRRVDFDGKEHRTSPRQI